MLDKISDELILYQKLFDALLSDSFQEIMEIAFRFTGVPILAADISYNLLGIFPQHKTGDYYWDYLLENSRYETDMILQLYQEGIMQSANNRTAPYVLDWGAATSEFPKIVGLIRVADTIEGYVVMQCVKGGITPEKMRAMEILQTACSILFSRTISISNMEAIHEKAFSLELFYGRIHTHQILNRWIRDLGIELKQPFQVAAICTARGRDRNVLVFAQRTLLKHYPFRLAMMEDNVLYVVLYGDTHGKTPTCNLQQITDFFVQLSLNCGISTPYCDLLQTPEFKVQAEIAMRLGMQYDPNHPIHHYKDLYLPAIFTTCMHQLTESSYLSPLIQLITDYDTAHSTDLLDTTRVYIKNLCNTALSAKELHIHRNSLLYRIRKIEDIIQTSLNEYSTFLPLIVSFYMMELRSKTKN